MWSKYRLMHVFHGIVIGLLVGSVVAESLGIGRWIILICIFFGAGMGHALFRRKQMKAGVSPDGDQLLTEEAAKELKGAKFGAIAGICAALFLMFGSAFLVITGLVEPETIGLKRNSNRPTSELIQMYESGNARTRQSAISGLRDRGAEAIPTLLLATKDEEPLVRSSAKHALYQTVQDVESALPILSESLRNEDQVIRSAAAHALARIDPEGIQVLNEALKEGNDGVFWSARVALDELQKSRGPWKPIGSVKGAQDSP